MLYGARTMQCLACGGGLEFAGGGAHARCQRCCRLFSVQGGGLTPLQVQAPGGGDDPQFNAMYAQQLGFAPRQPEMPQQQQQYPQQQYPKQQKQYPQPPPQQQQGYDMPNIVVKMKYDGMPIEFSSQGGLNTDKLEKHFTKKVDQKISGCIWGLVIGGIILVAFLGFGIWMWLQVKDAMPGGSASTTPARTPSTATAWDGKSTFECGGSDVVKLEGITASLAAGTAIKASVNCQLTLVNMNITAPVAIEAVGNARVTVTGGSLQGSTNSIVAAANAQVTVTGTKVTGKTKSSANGKITGVK